MSDLRYGLLGAGMMGQEHIRNVALLGDAAVTAICDPDDGMAAEAMRQAPGATRVPDLAALLDSGIDALIVASPNDCHAAQLREIMARRRLPVLMEKPLYTDPHDAAEFGALGADLPVWVAMEYRYMPPVARFIDRARDVTGGIRMLTIREHRFPFLDKVELWNRHSARTGGTMVEKCCHFFDLMRHILKADPVRVMASCGQDVNRLDEADVLDNGYVIVDFEQGSRAMLELCMFAEGSEYQEELSAIGPRGKIEAKVIGPGRFWPDHLGTPPVPLVVESPREPRGPVTTEVPVPAELLHAGDHNGSTFYQHERFARVVRGEASPEVTLADGAWAVRMGHAAQESARTGRSVSLVR